MNEDTIAMSDELLNATEGVRRYQTSLMAIGKVVAV